MTKRLVSALAAPALAASALAAMPAPAIACSVADDYRVPTNLELADEAELILLAEVAGGSDMEGSVRDWGLTLRPIAALKGELPQEDFLLPGAAIAPEQFLVLSNPYEFRQAHPLSYIGGCIRTMFPRGTTALFFLKQRDGEWSSAGGPFSRWAEDVPGEGAPWAVLTRLYVQAAGLAGEARKELLEAERDRLKARAEDPVAQLMAADIERQLAGPNEPWNVLMRRQMRQMGLPGDEAESPQEEEGSAVESALDAMRGSGDAAREDARPAPETLGEEPR